MHVGENIFHSHVSIWVTGFGFLGWSRNFPELGGNILARFVLQFVGFLLGGCPRGEVNWGTLRISREDWGTLGKIRGITTHP